VRPPAPLCLSLCLAIGLLGGLVGLSRAEVTAEPDAPGMHPEGQDIALQAVVSTTEPMVGETFRYTLRLLRTRAVTRAAVTPPDFPGFTVEALPGQRDTTITVAGRRYAVTELEYLLTPTRPGRAVLDPGAVVCRAEAGQTVRCQSAPLTVTVRPRPPSTTPQPQAPQAAAPLPAVAVAPLDLPASAARDATPPPWGLTLALALAGPALYGVCRLRRSRRQRTSATATLGPTALAEALRATLADRPPKQASELARALDRLDRLLYAGSPIDQGALEAAVRAARRVLPRNAP